MDNKHGWLPVPLNTKTIDAVDTDEPLIGIAYWGPLKYAKYKAATTTGDITLSADDTDGTTSVLAIDNSAAASDNWGQVVDLINGKNNLGWYAWPVSALRADLTEASAGNGVVIAVNTALTCWRKTVYLYHDTSALMTGVSNGEYVVTMGLTNKVDHNSSDDGRQIEISNMHVETTEATKDGTLNRVIVYECDDDAKTETIIFKVAGAASAAIISKTEDDFGDKPLTGGTGKRIVIRETNDVAMTAPLVFARWKSVPMQPRNIATVIGTSKM